MSAAPRRAYIGPCVDAVLGYWLAACNNEDEEIRDGMMEWWSTDAPDAALEIVHLIKQTLEDRGFEIVRAAASEGGQVTP